MNRYLLLLILMSSAYASAEVNKWVDSNNQVHYSDQPPPPNAKTSSPAKAKRPVPASDTEDAAVSSGEIPASTPAAPKTIAEREAELKKAAKAKQEAADKAAQQQADEQIKKANCDAAQKNLRTLQSGVRIAEIDASGERSFMSDEQLQQRTAKAQEDANKYCK